MNENGQLQGQIDEINRKLDTLLDYMHEQKLKRSSMEDLTSDLSIIGKDMYDTAVAELENYSVELDPDILKLFMIKLLKNIPAFTSMVNMIESLSDLAKDAGPMVNEMIIDLTKKLHEFETKGYFEFFRESGNVIDNIVKVFNSMNIDEMPDYSYWKLLKEFRSPEMRKGMTFMVMFMKNLAQYGKIEPETLNVER
ncbi:MAG: hypothetical protein JXB19_07510 [Bacteroidales bacterium]|nr:hypothetical protein [Bacteroidales bacterium]